MSLVFVREQLRAPLTLALLVALPFLFVVLAADVLGEFADALGGSLVADAATSLGAGWSAAFIAGTLGYFQVASSREADRRLARAGLGPLRVAAARIGAAVGLAVLAAGAAFLAMAIEIEIAHPWHAAAAILGYALIYLGIGALIGCFVRGELEGSLAVAFIFLLDVFSGPGMTEGDGSPLSVSRSAADVLLAAATGNGSPTGEWVELAAWTLGALALAGAAFVLSARSRA
jgi:hypothetical protein